MSIENGEYALGENVTRLAQSKKARDTVVVSVRLSVEDFSRLENMCFKTGMSMSQIVREAVAAYYGPGRTADQVFKMNMQTSEGATFAVGPVEYSEAPSISLTAGIPDENLATGRVWEERGKEEKRIG